MSNLNCERPSTLDKYLVNCFIDKTSATYDVPKQDLLNTWYSINGSFSLSHINEESCSESDSEYEYLTKEIVYSHSFVFGCETERDFDVRCKIAKDIKIAIEEYMTKNYPDYLVSILALFDGKNYELEIENENTTLYINGPEKELESIKIQLDSQVQHLYSCTSVAPPSIMSSLSKFFWL